MNAIRTQYGCLRNRAIFSSEVALDLYHSERERESVCLCVCEVHSSSNSKAVRLNFLIAVAWISDDKVVTLREVSIPQSAEAAVVKQVGVFGVVGVV